MITVRGKPYMNASEASRRLGVSRPTFYARYKDSLKTFKIGTLKRLYYRASDLEKVLDVLKVVEVNAA